MKTILITLLSLLLIISCETEPIQNKTNSCFEINLDDTIVHIIESKWILLGYENRLTGQEECKPDLLNEMMVSFTNNNRLKATSSCNSFEGYYHIQSNNLFIDSLSTTLIYCNNDTVMDWEEDYFKNLSKSISYVINGDILRITTTSDLDLVFRFKSSNALTNNDSFNMFCDTIPEEWSCQIYQDSFDTLPVPQGKNGRLENPLALIRYFNDTITCSTSKSLYLQIYDISKKDTLEKIISNSQMYSWCIPIFFGENERYYIITSPCYLNNGCLTEENLKPLFQKIKGLFTKSIIE